MDTMIIKALIYCRVSSERQKTEGHGLESQEQRCRLYAEQKGYQVEKVFKDSITGAGDFMKRPAMRAALEYIDSHPHQNYVIIFDDLKRFARDTVFHLKLRMELRGRGVRPECLNFNFEDNPEGEFVETVFAAQGELERKQNRRQVIQKQKARLELGYWPFNPPPGYRHSKVPGHGKLLTPVEPEARIIKAALEGFAVDRFISQGDIQRFLEKENFCGKKKIHFQLVNRLVSRLPIYAGFIEYVPWEVSRRQGHHQPLIDPHTFYRICEKLAGRKPLRTRKDMREDFPLRHTSIVCGKCGRSFTASYTRKKKGYTKAYYRCNNLNCDEHTKSIDRDLMERQFKKLLQDIRPKPLILKISEAILNDLWEKRLSSVAVDEKKQTQDLIRIQGEIRKLVGMAKRASSERVRLEYEKQIEELAREEEIIKENTNPAKRSKMQFRTALRMVFDYLSDPYSRWENGDLGEKQLVLSLVFEGVIFYDRGIGFRTAPLALPLRVFEHFTTSNSQGVETGGIEPPSNDAEDGSSTGVV